MVWLLVHTCKCYESCFSLCAFFLQFALFQLVSCVVYVTETESVWTCSLGSLTFLRLSLLRVILMLSVDFLLGASVLLVIFVHLLLAGKRHTTHAAHILGFFVDLLHVMARRQHLVLSNASHAVLGTDLLLSFALLASTLVEGRVQLFTTNARSCSRNSNAYLDFGVFENIAQVLSDAVLWSQVLLGEVDGLLVAKDGCRVRSEEFLFDTHIVVGDGEDSRTIL